MSLSPADVSAQYKVTFKKPPKNCKFTEQKNKTKPKKLVMLLFRDMSSRK